MKITRHCAGASCAALLVSGALPTSAQSQQAPSSSQVEQKEQLPPDQLDALVAPIALYPDPLLAQTLVASTYPLELIQLQQWLKKNPNLKDKELADAVAKQPWDPSVQSMAGLPDVVKRLADDIQWTTDLGNAFLAQESAVMDAVQRMRAKAKEKGTLTSTEQQKVETKVVESKTVIVVEQANPEVVYVPSYNPVTVYGPPVYAYPPIYYPTPRLLRRRDGDLFRFWHGDGGDVGRWLGLWTRMGWGQRSGQQLQQLQPEYERQPQRQRKPKLELAA